jgi:signal transduction histidine kinase
MVIERVDRASLTMQHVTETLLWLSRNDNASLPEQIVDLAAFIEHLVEEVDYLRNDAITVSLTTTPCDVLLPEPAARIVLSNLIRNAFQHTYHGTITITQRGNRVEIINMLAEPEPKQDNLGFGLGLQLTAQLSEKLGWNYFNEASRDGHHVIITVGTLPSETS